jgi:hypothetical protein
MATAKNSSPTNRIATYAVDPLSFVLDLQIRHDGGFRRLGDVAADFQLAFFRALAPALRSLAMGERAACQRFWTERPKGASKDSDLAAGVIWLLAFAPRQILVQSMAATQDQASELLKAAATICQTNPWLERRLLFLKNSIICEATGSRLDVLTATGEASHGARPDLVVADELSHSDEVSQSVLMDNAAKVPWSVCVVATNAGVVGSWQWRWRENARSSESWYFQAITEPPPWIPAEVIAEAERRNPPSRFRRLWKGEWSKAGGDALSEEDVHAAITLAGPALRPQADMVYVAGLDLGVKRDHSAFVVVGVKPGSGRISLARVQGWRPRDYQDGVDLGQVRQAILDLDEVFNFGRLIYDASQCLLLAGDLESRGIPVQEASFSAAGQNAMAVALTQVFRERSIDLFNDPELLTDLQRLSTVERPGLGGGMKLSCPRDPILGHADRAVALAMVLPLALEVANYRGESEVGEDVSDDDDGGSDVADCVEVFDHADAYEMFANQLQAEFRRTHGR